MKSVVSVLFLSLCCLTKLFSQAAIIRISPDNTLHSICGAGPTTVSITDILNINTDQIIGNGSCSWQWEVEGGTFENGAQSYSGGISHTIIWDVSTAFHKITINAGSCVPSIYNGLSGEFDFHILSVENVTLHTLIPNPNPISIGYNDRSLVAFSIQEIDMGKAEFEPTTNYCRSYNWTVPSGWTIDHFNSDQNVMYAVPDYCTPGIVSVQANYCGTTSSPYYINIARGPISSPNAISGNSVVYCANQTPITYTTSSSDPFLTTYQWAIPPGWTGSSSSNSITVVPNGISGGTVSAKLTACGVYSSAQSKNISLQLSPSTVISGPSPICSSGTYSISNAPSNTTSTSWYSSNGSGLSINSSSGAATRQNNFNGQVVVSATINGACGTLTVPSLRVYVGTPTFTSVTTNGVANTDLFGTTPYPFSVNQNNNAIVRALTSSSYHSGHVNFTLLHPAGSNVSGSAANDSTYNFNEKVNYGFPLTFTASNACGTITGTVYYCNSNCTTLQSPIRHGASVTASPNPASTTLTMQVTDSLSANNSSNTLDQPYEVHIMDKFSRKVFFMQSNEKRLEIPVGSLAPDIYYLNLIYGDAVLQKQIVIKR